MKKLLSIIAAGTLMSSTAASVVACDKPSEKDDAKPASAGKAVIENKDMFIAPEMVWSETNSSQTWLINLATLNITFTRENIHEEIVKFISNSLSPILKEALKNNDSLNQTSADKGLTFKQWFDKNIQNIPNNNSFSLLVEKGPHEIRETFDTVFHNKEYKLNDKLLYFNLNNPKASFIFSNK
ncbi:lipoprotein [Spiroplasma clarkii]|uniref:Lipoprotein n=1 Tax=Spiroplasma clarkii TaxID=2139 RepID=A0A2K8KG33_9MOLU|nr:lipoprotein [Spiroplasma clarkii]ATX70650.1 hypothetical protein SCLAR_v1c03200 [Spiroplasma clarkii]